MTFITKQVRARICLAAVVSGLIVPNGAVEAAQPAAPVAAVSYSSNAGSGNAARPTEAIRLTRSGIVSIAARDGRREMAQFTRAELEAICPALYDGTIRTLSQRSLDAEIRSLARTTELDGVRDAETCYLSLPTRDGVVTLRMEAPSLLCERFGERGQLTAKFERLRTELERLRQTVLLGGPVAAARICDAASAQCGAALNLSDLQFADRFEGTTTAHFRRGELLVMVSRTGTEITVDVFGRVQTTAVVR